MSGTPLRFVLDPVGDELTAALDCEADVFLQTYGNTIDQLADEYGPYAEATGFMTLLNENCLALATTRFIAPGPAGLKTLNDARRAPWNVDGMRSALAAGIDPSKTWDIATIAVRRSSRGSPAAAALYHGIATAANANNIDSIIMIMDARARRLPTDLPRHRTRRHRAADRLDLAPAQPDVTRTDLLLACVITSP